MEFPVSFLDLSSAVAGTLAYCIHRSIQKKIQLDSPLGNDAGTLNNNRVTMRNPKHSLLQQVASTEVVFSAH